MATEHTNFAERNQLEAACAIVCNAVADLGFGMGWHVRLRAAQMLLTHLVGASPEPQLVRAVVYGRSALYRLGSAPIPQTEAEFAHYREQVGPAMLLLGYDEPHAVLIVDDRVLVELYSWNDHDDPGVLIQPFVRDMGTRIGSRFTVEKVASGGAVAYELVAGELHPLNRTYEQMALQLARAAAPQVRWQLDAPRHLRERSA